ncbi:MAG: helix-turn-helix transcriptional regulator [Verrucomicrobia bacterium]|nr:helix-turn-helix transcriptional regulator [Verrucomicrobiota bacterium]
MVASKNPQRGVQFAVDSLSARELEVFKLLGEGFSTREIAQQLNLSTKTIDTYRDHLKLKLGVENGGDLIHYAVQWSRIQTAQEISR